MKAVAQEYIDQDFKIIPLSKKGDGKAPGHTRNPKPGLIAWQETEFKANDVFEDDNIGFNVGTSELIEDDNDSDNASYFAPRFLNSTKALGVKAPDGRIKVTHNLYRGKTNYIKRCYPDGATIAELRSLGNLVVPPSIAESKLFNKEWCERVWINNLKVSAAPDDLVKQFNKKCVASVLRKVIDSNNLDFVKLTACLKRYCVENGDWSEDELWKFIEIVCNSLRPERCFKWKDVKAKVKNVLDNYDNNPESKQSGYESFADQVGLTQKYARDMFTWIGEVPKQGSEKDRKTIIDFVAMGMSTADFEKEVVRTYIADEIICDEGLYVVAGKPKGGKSYVLQDLAFKVQNQTNMYDLKWLGQTVHQGDVLLLALEDSKDSMNLRVRDMNLKHKKKPTIFTEYTCPTLERGFIESVRLWHSKMSKPKLVIIDPFQKIKPMGEKKTRNSNAYEVDYYYLSQLHALAKELKICIIYVHHLSQADKGHKWDKIMGSTGHQGVTDAMYMLERDEGTNCGTFEGIGRNIPAFKYDIAWNSNPKEPFTFQYDGDHYQIAMKKHKKNIMQAMLQLAKEGEAEVKPSQVYKVLNLVSNKEKGTCQKNMLRMRKKSELRDGETFGTYKLRYPADCYDKDGNVKPEKAENVPWSKEYKPPASSSSKPAASSEGQIDFEVDKIKRP